MWMSMENKREKRILFNKRGFLNSFVQYQSLRMQGAKTTIVVLDPELINMHLLS